MRQREEDKQSDAELGDRIRYLRKLLDIPRQEDFAERLGVTRGAVANWEAGKGVKLTHLKKIAEEFQCVSLEWLATGHGSPVLGIIDAQLKQFPPEEYVKLREDLQLLIDLRRKQIAERRRLIFG